LSELKNKTLFSIHIIEHDDGRIYIMSECVGKGANAREVGLEILVNLEEAAQTFPEAISVAPFTYSESRH